MSTGQPTNDQPINEPPSNEPPILVPAPPENIQGPYIEFREVSKSFGDNHVLDGVSFNVMPGETVCILGRSGVGKSVSLQILMGFLKADSGRVIVAGEDITNFTEEQMEAIRKKVTMVFQNGALFDSLTVGENVAFPLREGGGLSEKQIYEVVDGLLKMVGVEHMRDLLPSDLSTGMKRSVAIARALAARPECILYDEPTTMVDPLMAQLLGDSHQAPQNPTAPHQHRRHPRHAPRRKARRPRRLPARRQIHLLRNLRRNGKMQRTHHSGIPLAG